MDGGYGLLMWKVAVNLLNKQLWAADKGWFSILGFGEGVTTSHCKNQACHKMLHRASDFNRHLAGDRYWWWSVVSTMMNLCVP